jgi:hypothetical protein
MHYGSNYGGFLQSFALQNFLGDDNTILNFTPNYSYYVGYAGRKKLPFFWRIEALRRYFKNKPFEEINRLKLSRKYSRQEEIIKNPPVSDVFIVGSDIVWNFSSIYKRERAYFLDFGNPQTRRVSYAASLGGSRWGDNESTAISWLQKFNAISVREESSAEYLRGLGIKAVCVCDPTVLHNAEFYRKQFPYDSNIDRPFVYRLREKFPQLFYGDNIIHVDIEKQKNMVSVSQWLSCIDNAQWIATDSFHCCVFAILFHKKFVFVPRPESKRNSEANERVNHLLQKTKLKNHLLPENATKEQIMEIINHPVNWIDVDAILDEWRNYSKNWLNDALR